MLESEQILATANAAIFELAGRYLSDVETAIFLGAIADGTYEQISQKSGYTSGIGSNLRASRVVKR